jgi:hypothetical protein
VYAVLLLLMAKGMAVTTLGAQDPAFAPAKYDAGHPLWRNTMHDSTVAGGLMYG